MAGIYTQKSLEDLMRHKRYFQYFPSGVQKFKLFLLYETFGPSAQKQAQEAKTDILNFDGRKNQQKRRFSMSANVSWLVQQADTERRKSSMNIDLSGLK